jgi:type I restriction enzyme, S subunit
MEAEAPSYNIESLRRMVETFGERIEVATVSELSERGVIFVEDGNHGENRPRQDEFATTGIAFLRPPDLKDGRVDFQSCSRINDAGFKRVRKGIGRRGDIILTHRATVGRIAITDDDAPEVFVTNPGTTIWRSIDPNVLDQRFLYCFMRSAAFMDQLWSQVGNNSTFDYVSLTQQRGLRVAYPPIAEQKAIAAVLGALDDKIELNRRMNATLEAMARALFQSWFVDFDPVRAKLDGRKPVGLDPDTAALFSGAFQESIFGHIPNGWTVGRVADVSDFSRSSINPGLYADEAFDHYSLPAFDADRAPKTEFGSAIMSNKLVVIRDSVLLSKLNPHIPRIWLPVLHPTRRSVCSTEFIVAAPRHGYSREFLFSLFTSAPFGSTYCTLVTGTTGSHQRIRPESVLDMKIVLPPSPLVNVFTAAAKPMLNKINRNLDQSRMLATLRDTLLPKLLSGELGVGELNPIKEAAA